jgi:hypothetical protein
MAKQQRPIINVIVYADVQDEFGVQYTGWCTSVEIAKDGALKLFEGWRQRAYHPAGSWSGYAVVRQVDGTKPMLGVVAPKKDSAQ